MRIGRDEFEELLDDFLRSMDQPTIDGLNTYLVSRAAATQGLKVALSGLGGDELFGGYPSFRQIPTLLKWGRRIPLPKSLGRAVQAIFRTLPLPGLPPKAAGLLSHSGDIASAYLLRRALYLEDELDALLDESWLNEGLERLSTVRSDRRNRRALSDGGRHALCAGRRAGILLVHAQPVTARHRLVEHGPWLGSARSVCGYVACLNASDRRLPRMRRPTSKTSRLLQNACQGR